MRDGLIFKITKIDLSDPEYITIHVERRNYWLFI